MHAQDLALQVKVGVTLVAAVVLGWLGYSLVMVGSGEPTYHVWVEFENIQGIREGSEVKKAGTDVGYVRTIELNEQGRARTKLEIEESLSLPEDATFTVNASSYIGESYMSIAFPSGPPSGSGVEEGHEFDTGKRAPTFEDLLERGDRILASADQLVQSANTYIEQDPVGRQIEDLNKDLQLTLENVNALIDNLDSQVSSTGGKLDTTLNEAQMTAKNFREMSEQLKTTVGDEELQKSLVNMSSNLEQSSERLNRILEDVEDISGDEDVKSNIKETTRLTRQTVESADKTLIQLRTTLSKFDRTLDGVNDVLGQEGDGENNIEFDKDFTSRAVFPRQEGESNQFRGDFNTRLRVNQNMFRFGVDNIGEGSDVRLQAGRKQGNFELRGGVYRGELSAGASVESGNLSLELDSYDPNDVKTNSYLGYSMGPGYRILFGVEDAFDENHLVTGLRYEF